MLTLVGLHHELITLAAFRLLVGRFVGFPPSGGKLTFRYEGLAHGLLSLGVGI